MAHSRSAQGGAMQKRLCSGFDSLLQAKLLEILGERSLFLMEEAGRLF